jgi:hypothetical protein
MLASCLRVLTQEPAMSAFSLVSPHPDSSETAGPVSAVQARLGFPENGLRCAEFGTFLL